MPLLFTAFFFVVVVVGVASLGMRMYVRPKEAIERVVGGIDPSEHIPVHPSLALHELIKKLGNIVPQSPKDVTVMQRRLIRAGIRKESALKVLYGAKAILGILFPIIALAMVAGSDTDPGKKFIVVLLATAMGFF